jgi:hypothetical protein
MRPRSWLITLGLPALLASGCSCDDTGGSATSPAGSPWAPTTTPFDPTCAACKEIGAGSIAHVGEARVLVDTKTDDPQAQWGRCALGFMKCLDGGGAIPACIADAPCPAACKGAFEAELAGASGFDAEAAAVDRVFFDDGAPCAPPGPEEVPS